jgi:hypothetical protein
MGLALRSKTVATLALALAVGGLAPGTSAGQGLTHQEVTRLAQQSRQDPASVAQAPVLPSNLGRQTRQADIVAPPTLPPARASELAAIQRAEERQHAAGSYRPSPAAHYSSAETDTYAALEHPVAPSALTVHAPGEAFDYGAAAIGAGFAVVIMVLIAAGGVAVRRRGQPQHG